MPLLHVLTANAIVGSFAGALIIAYLAILISIIRGS